MEQENQNQEQAPEVRSPEEIQAQHDADMIAKVDASAQATEDSLKTDEERMLAGKYNSVEELEKAYLEAQKKISTPEEDTESQGEEEEAPQETDEAKEAVENAGLDFTAFDNEYQETGQLSDDTFNALEEAGIPRNMAEAYIAGQEAIAQNTITTLQDSVGGEAEYNSMLEWAEESLPEVEIAAFNNSLTDLESTQFAINGLYARYSAEKGPNLIKGNQNTSQSGGYASKQEMMLDMVNPKYGRDPAFRASVQRRVALSSF